MFKVLKHPRFAAVSCVLAAIGLVATPYSASAGQVAPPPLTLSPNLTKPWVLQLQPKPRTKARSTQRGNTRTQRGRRPLPANWWSNARANEPQTTRSTPRQTRQRQINPQFLPSVVDYRGPHGPGTIVINTNERYLYLVQRDGTARRYGVGVGKPGFEWAGSHKVTRKAEWPDWRPPAEMRQRRPDLPTFMAGGPENPLGARALYLGSTLYRIHGSNEPWSIGHAVSSGCIRMRNEDVMDLYERVPVGATVHVI